MKIDKPTINSKINQLKQHITPKNIFMAVLNIGSTFAAGLLTYAGAIAVGFNLPFALLAFALTAVVCIQVNFKMISKALASLENFINDLRLNSNLSNKYQNLTQLLAIAISILAAISFSACTLFAAVSLFSPISAGILGIVTGVAYFFIAYQTIIKSFKFYSPKNLIEKTNEFLKNLGSKSLQTKALIFSALLAFVVPICLYSVYLTIPAWLVETQLGLGLLMPAKIAAVTGIITAIFQIASNLLFLTINPLKAVFRLSNFELPTGSTLINKVRTNKSRLFNPIHWLIIAIDKTLTPLGFIAHCISHAFLAGSRDIIATVVNTLSDSFADASFTVIRNKHNHSHEPFEFIMLSIKTILTLPLQLLAVPTSFLIKLFTRNTDEKLKNKSNKELLTQSLKENFYFVDDYIACKECSHKHDAHEENSKPQNDSINSRIVRHRAVPDLELPITLSRSSVTSPLTPIRQASSTQSQGMSIQLSNLFDEEAGLASSISPR